VAGPFNEVKTHYYTALYDSNKIPVTSVSCLKKGLGDFAKNEYTCSTPPDASTPPVTNSPCGNKPNPKIPLDPGNGGRSIGTSDLQIGDIILSTTNQIQSIAVRIATNAPASHTILYVGDGKVIEAVGSGVGEVPIGTALDDATLAVAVRYQGLTSEQASKIIDFASQQLGKPYDFRYGVFGQALFRLDLACGVSPVMAGVINLGTSTNDKWFCFELVCASFDAAGVPLTETPPSWTAPGDIIPLVSNGPLEYVGHLKMPPIQGGTKTDSGTGFDFST
jgi:hypothetical protein